jgi:ATP/maltotriose-dependent transcriptional regulator MalT
MHRALTPVERRILTLAANGYTPTQIGKTFDRPLALETVRSHFMEIYRALGVRDRAHAVATALRWRLIDVAEVDIGMSKGQAWETQIPGRERNST